MAISVIYILLFALSGLGISAIVFRAERLHIRIWLGLVLGLAMLTWLPSLFAFFLGFRLAAQILSAVLAVLLAAAALLYGRFRLHLTLWHRPKTFSLTVLAVSLPIFAVGCGLLYTHIIQPRADGSLWVGQVTYGDLAMHLGFISSIATQGTFPPNYSIFPGHPVNYPFLCETSASSLYVLGADLRSAYLLTALYALLLVTMGVYLFFEQWLKRRERAVLATLLFFFGGGFGFAYFFDLAKSGASLSAFLGGSNSTNLQYLLDGFYQTPTNLPTIGLRWVNPIVDMLVPQRATLFGWAFLFPCLYMLHGFKFEKKEHLVLPLGVLAGALPLIHTHSFLALGIISAVYFMSDLLFHSEKKRILRWVIYAGIACTLAAPQLFGFAFAQAQESGMVRLHLNWANTADSFLWFYLKNWGMLFLLLPFAFLLLSKKDRSVYSGSLLIWLICELFVFQPNTYDNNKLLFLWFAYTCGLVAKLICVVRDRLRRRIAKTESLHDQVLTLGITVAVLLVGVVLYLVLALRGRATLYWYVCCTLLLLLAFASSLLLTSAWLVRSGIRVAIPYTVLGTFGCYVSGSILYALYHGYQNSGALIYDDGLERLFVFSLVLLIGTILTILYYESKQPKNKGRKPKMPPKLASIRLTRSLGAFTLATVLFLASAMTIVREFRSEYQVYSASDIEVVEFIKENTENDAIFLANSYLWNLVTPLTGRSIVTGTATFLYYHGIDNTQRESDVRQLYEYPAECLDLFDAYGVDYVLLSNAERYNYAVDESYFRSNCESVFENSSATIYKLPDPAE